MTTMDDGSALEDGDKFDEHENDYEYEHGEDKCNEYMIITMIMKKWKKKTVFL